MSSFGKRFYVDLNQLAQYSDFLNKSMKQIDIQNNYILNATKKYQSLINDDISRQTSDTVRKIMTIMDVFSSEVEKMKKNVNRDYELYQNYLKGLK